MKKVFNKHIYFLILIILYFLLSGNFKNLTSSNFKPAITPSPTPVISFPNKQAVKVLYVIDGDTIVVDGKKTVRYIGIDTPETKHPEKAVQCFGSQASEENKKLVEGKFVRLEKDVSEADRYGRLLRYVYLADPYNASVEGLFVNDYLVREGFAHGATFPPDVKFAEQFKLAEIEARRNNRGLWKACPN